MRNLILTLTASIFATSLTLLFVSPARRPLVPATLPPPPPLTIEQVQALGALVTTRVTVRVECTERCDGYLGGLATTWQGSGSVLLGPDLQDAEIIDRDDAAHTATVLLPEPTVLEQTLHLSAGRIHVELEGLWQAVPDERLIAAEQHRALERAQAMLIDGITAKHRDASRRSAEAVLQRLGRSLGWALRARWQTSPDRHSPSSKPSPRPLNPSHRSIPMSDPAMTDRLIRLASTDSHLFVIPPDDAQPFTVPQFPMSQLVWLDHLTTAFHNRRRRCLCVALILDVSTRVWGRPEVPTQQCGRDGVRWAWDAEDFNHRSSKMLVGGTFQSVVLADLNEAISVVPPFDGVHFVDVKQSTSSIHAFVHVNGQTVEIDAHRLVIDDVADTLNTNSQRLTLD